MVEPIGVASTSAARALTSVITKHLQSKVGVRLGSREERRQVYAQYQEAVTEVVMAYTAVTLHQRLYFGEPFGGSGWSPTGSEWSPKPTEETVIKVMGEGIERLAQAHGRLRSAYLDLRLAANPEPLAAAGAVMRELEAVSTIDPAVTDDHVNEVTDRVIDAQVQFTDVCRDDLWYLPKRWQIYRPAWWSARRWRSARHTS